MVRPEVLSVFTLVSVGAVLPLATSLLALCLVVALRRADRNQLPAELQYEGEASPPGLVKGSPVVAAGAVISVLLLWLNG